MAVRQPGPLFGIGSEALPALLGRAPVIKESASPECATAGSPIVTGNARNGGRGSVNGG
jgi:hypothetical protein